MRSAGAIKMSKYGIAKVHTTVVDCVPVQTEIKTGIPVYELTGIRTVYRYTHLYTGIPRCVSTGLFVLVLWASFAMPSDKLQFRL